MDNENFLELSIEELEAVDGAKWEMSARWEGGRYVQTLQTDHFTATESSTRNFGSIRDYVTQHVPLGFSGALQSQQQVPGGKIDFAFSGRA